MAMKNGDVIVFLVGTPVGTTIALPSLSVEIRVGIVIAIIIVNATLTKKVCKQLKARDHFINSEKH